MTREFLKGLELDSDMINKIMTEYGKSVERTNEKVEDLKGKLEAFKNFDVEKFKNVDLDALNTKISDYETRIKEFEEDTTVANLTAENKALKEEKILTSHGIVDEEDREIYSIRLNKLVTDEKDFETTAKEYFEANPIKQVPPAFHTGESKTTTKSGNNKSLKEMSVKEAQKLFKENPEQYAKLKEN